MANRASAFLAFLLLAALPACGSQLSSPARTEVPLYIAPFSPTSAPTLTPTALPATYLSSGAEEQVPQGYFTFAPVTLWDASGLPLSVQIQGEQVALSNSEETLFFNLANEPARDTASSQDCLSKILHNMDGTVDNFTASEPRSAPEPRGESLTVDITGSIFTQPSVGRLVVSYADDYCFSGLGLATSSDSQTLWAEYGEGILDAMLGTVFFYDPAMLTSCKLSPDETYGFSPSNPIGVGNTNLYDGREREEAYLLTLRGPAYEEVFFTRQVPFFNDLGVIVDPYLVEYDGIPASVTLYFDMYFYNSPMAPVGFTCEAAFPLSAP